MPEHARIFLCGNPRVLDEQTRLLHLNGHKVVDKIWLRESAERRIIDLREWNVGLGILNRYGNPASDPEDRGTRELIDLIHRTLPGIPTLYYGPQSNNGADTWVDWSNGPEALLEAIRRV